LLDCVAPETLLQHERGTGRNPSNAISILCCYDAEKSLELGGYKLFIDLLKVHNHNIFKGRAGAQKRLARLAGTSYIRNLCGFMV